MSLSAHDWHIRFMLQANWTSEIRDYLFTRSRLGQSSLVLDVGCGTGVLETELGLQGLFNVHAVDINFEYLNLAKFNSPETFFAQGDGHTLPYANKIFDIVFCHYLLLWVTDASKVIHEMARITRPGGMVTALAEPDYGGRIDYPPPLDELGKLQTKSLELQGADIIMGRKLGKIFSKAGLEKIEIGVLGGQWIKPLSSSEINSEWRVLRSDIDTLTDNELTYTSLKDLYQLDLRSWESRERILFVPTFYACGQVPE
jgi:ubiquinone/menaquinone biosynthesis C-methylase UbiE